MESDENVEERIRRAESVNTDPERTWISPVGVPTSRQRLVDLPQDELGFDGDEGPERIADVGCGDGTLTAALAEQYGDSRVVGVDWASTGVTLPSCENATIIDGDLFSVLQECALFDVMYAVNVLQEVRQPTEALSLFHDSLRDGGYLVLAVPGEDAGGMLPDRFHRVEEDSGLPYIVFGEDDDPDRLRNYKFPQQWVKQQCERIGFSVLDTFTLEADDSSVPEILENHGIEPVPEWRPLTVDTYLLQKEAGETA